MSQLNVNNTDDLFKRASEEYPLRTDSSDWGKLSAALEKDPSLILPPLNEDEGRRKKRRFFWLFFLLPLGGLGYYAWQTHSGSQGRQIEALRSQSAAGPAAAQSSAGEPTSSAGDQRQTPAAGQSTGKPGNAGTGTTAAASTPKDIDGSSTKVVGAGSEKSTLSSARSIPPTGYPIDPDSKTGSRNATATSHITATHRPSGVNNGQRNAATGRSTEDDRPNGQTDLSSVTGSPINERGQHNAARGNNGATAGGLDIVPASQPAFAMPGYSPLKAQRVHMGEAVLLDIPVRANSTNPAAVKSDVSPKPAASARAKPKNKTAHSFYAGILVAPDLSTVKYQSVKGLGITTSILLGYTINNRWSIETGAYLDVKKYYSEGQYFSKKKLPALWNVDIKTVDGSCNMIEIPLNARYNLNTSEKRRWFATGGLTSYLMYREAYSYELEYSGTTWPKSVTYHNPSQSWFSQIGLSIGYEEKLGKIGSLRLEPYLRIPLAGIGTGSLPITSAGLNIGLTHKFR